MWVILVSVAASIRVALASRVKCPTFTMSFAAWRFM